MSITTTKQKHPCHFTLGDVVMALGLVLRDQIREGKDVLTSLGKSGEQQPYLESCPWPGTIHPSEHSV